MELNLHEWGDSAAPPVVCLHGVNAHGRRFRRLAEERFIEGSAAHDLGEAFVFCSDVKNALEVDRRLHAEALPSDPAAQTALARRLGYEAYPRQSFLDDYLRITRRCRRAMERVFQQAS